MPLETLGEISSWGCRSKKSFKKFSLLCGQLFYRTYSFYTRYYHPRHLIPTLSPLRASRFGPKRGILLHPVFSDLSYEYFHLYYDY
jgi:hypothetical protein